jgi:hypothetical protein
MVKKYDKTRTISKDEIKEREEVMKRLKELPEITIEPSNPFFPSCGVFCRLFFYVLRRLRPRAGPPHQSFRVEAERKKGEVRPASTSHAEH